MSIESKTGSYFSLFWLPKKESALVVPFYTRTTVKNTQPSKTVLYDADGKELKEIMYDLWPEQEDVIKAIEAYTFNPKEVFEQISSCRRISLAYFPRDFDYTSCGDVKDIILNGAVLQKVEDPCKKLYSILSGINHGIGDNLILENFRTLKPLYDQLEAADESVYEKATIAIGKTIREIFGESLQGNITQEFKKMRAGFKTVINMLGINPLTAKLNDLDDIVRQHDTTKIQIIIEQPASDDYAKEYFAKIEKNLLGIGWSNSEGLADAAREYQKGIEKFGSAPPELGNEIKKLKRSMVFNLNRPFSEIIIDW